MRKQNNIESEAILRFKEKKIQPLLYYFCCQTVWNVKVIKGSTAKADHPPYISQSLYRLYSAWPAMIPYSRVDVEGHEAW